MNQNVYRKRTKFFSITIGLVIISFIIAPGLFAQKSISGNFIYRWLTLGPFIEGKQAPKAIKVDYLLSATGESESQYATLNEAPNPGDSVALTPEKHATQVRVWKAMRLSGDGDIGSMLVQEGNIDCAVAYFCTFIESSKMTRRKLMIGSDDAVKVWLNGEVVHEAAVDRPLTPDEDKVFVYLKKGMNCLMLKVANSGLDWGITVRFADESGLHFFDTSSRQFVSLGKKIIRLPKFEVKVQARAGKEGFWRTYRYVDGLANNNVNTMMQDRQGAIWFGTRGGVTRFDAENWKTYTKKDGLAHNMVFTIMQDNEGNIWFGTVDGISQFNGKNWKTHRPRGKIPRYTRNGHEGYSSVSAIIQGKDSVVWANIIGGVARFDGKSWKRYTQEEELGHNSVSAIMQDNEGAIWLGTRGGGVRRLDEKSWKTYTKKDELAPGPVNTILQDRTGTMWFGTWRGVTRFDGEDWMTFSSAKESPPVLSHVYDMVQDKKGKIWLGTWEGLIRVDGKNRRIYTRKDGLASNWVHAMLEDDEGTMWFGTRGGVTSFDGRNWKTYTKKDGLAHNAVFAIMQDNEGALWFGTWKGISRFDGKNWRTYTKQDGLADNRISAMIQDSQGNLWFGTNSGVTRFDGKNWRTYTKEDGLASNDVRAIMEDQGGILWFGTNGGGVSCFDGRCFQTIDSRDGLPNDSVHCIYVDKSRQIWFGTNEGPVRFTPNKIPPPVYITQIVTDEKTYIKPEGTIQLNKPIQNLTLNYHAISFKTRPSEMKYFYQLVGYDDDWQGPTNEETIKYFKLKPREYTFRVQAVDRDLNYSKTGSVLIIIPSPPFYQTEFFPILLSIIGGVLLFGIIALGVKHFRLSRTERRRLQRELEDARQMQLRLLPESAPTVEGFDIAGTSLPAKEVGGDFFDYLLLNDGKIGIALADVSGKGLKGAMNAVLANGMLNTVAKIEASCGNILSTLNGHLYPRMEKRMFTALGLSIFDGKVEISDQRHTLVQWANAAQPYPIVRRKDQVFELEGDGGIPLGVMQNSAYYEQEFELQVGDIVVFYTDGISEAVNKSEEMYGSERLQHAIKNVSLTMNSAEIVQGILRDVVDFVGDVEQYDDMTVVVVKKEQ